MPIEANAPKRRRLSATDAPALPANSLARRAGAGPQPAVDVPRDRDASMSAGDSDAERKRALPAPAALRGRPATPDALATAMARLAVVDRYSMPVNGMALHRRLADVAASLEDGSAASTPSTPSTDSTASTVSPATDVAPLAVAPTGRALTIPRAPRRTCASLPRMVRFERIAAQEARPRASTFPRTHAQQHVPPGASVQPPQPALMEEAGEAQERGRRPNALGLFFRP